MAEPFVEPFAGSAFLDVARSLCRPEASQADLRTAIGRAYYAVFLAHVEPVAKHLGIPYQDIKHQPFRSASMEEPGFCVAVASCYKKPILQGLADSLYNLRICADYRPTNPAMTRQFPHGLYINYQRAKYCIEQAEKFFVLTGVP